MSRIKAEYPLSCIMADLWNGLKVKIRQMSVKVRDEKRV
jgi:hypothetical protein